MQTVTNDTVLTASGDSVTSAHHQWGYGPPPMPPCWDTSFDDRGLPGNNGVYSYARRYFDMNTSIVDYENFARTGFDTADMLFAGAGTGDACGNPWARAWSPIGLSAGRIAKAKQDSHNAYHVTTGGANNTNWSQILPKLIECRGYEYAANSSVLNFSGRLSFKWPPGGKESIVTRGGGCQFRVDFPDPVPDWIHAIIIPPYDGPTTLPGVTANATAIVNWLLAAGVDKFVWMLYYDITPANLDISKFAWTMLRRNAPAAIKDYLPPEAVSVLAPMFDPAWIPAAQALINELNFAIWLGIPYDPKVRVAFPPAFTAADIQVTAVGGSPHPSPWGQDKLANTLAGVFNSIP